LGRFREAKVITLNLLSFAQPNERQGRPPLRPNRIYPIAAVVVIALHALVFAAFIRISQPALTPLGTIDAELVPEGDFFDADAIRETDVAPDEPEPKKATTEQPEDAAPPVAVPVRDAPRLPIKKEIQKTAEKPRPKAEKKQPERRALTPFCVIKATGAQATVWQDKRDSLRLGPAVGLLSRANTLLQAANFSDSLSFFAKACSDSRIGASSALCHVW
jgi:hypothetical protein